MYSKAFLFYTDNFARCGAPERETSFSLDFGGSGTTPLYTSYSNLSAEPEEI
jgi:hypothetical protein